MAGDARAVRRRHALEIVSTVLRALAAVSTAWASYQASRWHGQQSCSGSMRIRVTRRSSRTSISAGSVTSSGRRLPPGSRPSRSRTPALRSHLSSSRSTRPPPTRRRTGSKRRPGCPRRTRSSTWSGPADTSSVSSCSHSPSSLSLQV
jgi:hypothetical protein